MSLEIEYRAQLTETQSAALADLLSQRGKDLGQDDKDIWFYVLPNHLLKVVRNISAGDGKVVVKSSKIGEGAAFPEVELPIAAEDVETAVKLFDALGYAPYMHQAHNDRHNWGYKGVEFALKWSAAWGHHVELEVLLADDATAEQIEEAHRRIHAVAADCGVRLMTEQELAEFIRRFEEAQAAKAS